MAKIVLATENRKKFEEMVELLAGLPLEPVFWGDLTGRPKIDEGSPSYRENAEKKATAAAEFSGLLALADDSGIEVEALGSLPGPFSARFFGPGLDDGSKNEKLLRLLRDVDDERRGAKFVCVLALSQPGGSTTIFEGHCEGRIARCARGLAGFGYDPIFIPIGHQGTFAELGEGLKNRISHRAKAFEKLRAFLLGSSILAKDRSLS